LENRGLVKHLKRVGTRKMLCPSPKKVVTFGEKKRSREKKRWIFLGPKRGMVKKS